MLAKVTPPLPYVSRGSQRLPATITGRCEPLHYVYAVTPEQPWALTFDADTGMQIGGEWVLTTEEEK
jgi:hypothetical protein